ncbi:Ger(x)C family spore germination protein [Caldifermentibacillus hisashii]|uniref:Ger(x)C family spore germination protein n=1 Tax=Caldifermentibacillus hisashii TaxID=996558 RepID=UPI003100D298
MTKRLNLFAFICITILLAGCWNHRELTDIGIIAAVGIDYGQEKRYNMTFQFVNPRNVAGNQQTIGISGPPIAIYESEGDNLLEAARSASQHVSRQLYFAHTNVLMIGEEVARDGLTDVLDISIRNPDFRSTATIVIAKDSTAEQILKTLTPLDQIPANKIDKTLKFSENRWGESINISVGELVPTIYSKGKQAVVGGFIIKGDKEKGSQDANILSSRPLAQLNSDGLGLLKGGKLITWAEGKTARGINWILNNVKSTVVNIDWKDKKNAFGITINLSKSKVSANVKNNKPYITVHIDAEGGITEADTFLDLSKAEELIKVQNALRKEIKREIENSIQFAQKHKADVFGFGEKISHVDEVYWKKVADVWNEEIFPNLEVKVEVNAFIRRTYLITKPFLYEHKGND